MTAARASPLVPNELKKQTLQDRLSASAADVTPGMPFKQGYAFVWAPPPGSSGTPLVFGLSDDGMFFELYIDQASLKI